MISFFLGSIGCPMWPKLIFWLMVFYHVTINCVQCGRNVGHVVPCAFLVCGKENCSNHCGEFAYFLFLHSVTIRDYFAYIFISAPCSANTNSANKIVLKFSASILQTDWRDSLLEWIICVRIFNIYIITHYINTTPSYIYKRIFQGCYSNQLKSA